MFVFLEFRKSVVNNVLQRLAAHCRLIAMRQPVTSVPLHVSPLSTAFINFVADDRLLADSHRSGLTAYRRSPTTISASENSVDDGLTFIINE